MLLVPGIDGMLTAPVIVRVDGGEGTIQTQAEIPEKLFALLQWY